MAKNEKDEAKKAGEAIFNKYAKDAEAEHMSEIEQMLKDAGVDIVVAGSYVYGADYYSKAIKSLQV